MSASYKLYFDYETGSFVPHVMLEELGVGFELVHVDTSAEAHKTDEFRKINPNMPLPALGLPDGRTVGENGAILVTLGERHPQSALVARRGDEDWPYFLQWLFALATTGHTTIRRFSYPDEYSTRADAHAATSEAAWNHLNRFFGALDETIAGDPWFMARGFSALDIYTALVCLVLEGQLRVQAFDARPKLARLYRAVHARDSVRKLWAFYGLPPVSPL